jgi:hypothetical protein
MFSDRVSLGFIRHGWVRSKSGIVYDPTRWVFEAADPYIFRGLLKEHPEYDEGGTAARAAFRMPPPAMTGNGEKWDTVYKPNLKPNVLAFLLLLLGDSQGFNQARLYWLAGFSPEELGFACKPLYRYLEQIGKRAAIPIDNWQRVMEE